MTLAWWETSRLFDQVVDLSPTERERFLQTLDDPDQRRELESLLEHDGRSTDFLASSAFDVGARLLIDGNDLHPGTDVGNYRIVRPLGAGGMGSVYLAERADHRFEQRVALKVVHAELASPELRRRFRGERQILATLEHPSIARLIDGGELDDGRPYLVMELVEGVTLDRHCEDHALPVRERLELFGQVCDVVQAAHARRIVHRDLKPGNILVDAEGRLRLVDFGTAGLLPDTLGNLGDDPPSDDVLFATPEYRSPELSRGGPVTTAVDLYSLGIVLARLVAIDRTSSPRDLRSIVERACADDPEDRYATAADLGRDVRRYLDRRPLQARPRGPLGRLVLAVRRRPWVSLTTAVVLALALFFVATLRSERDRARRALDRSELAGDFLVDLFAVADPGSTAGRPLTAQDLLARGARMLDHGSLDPPLRLQIVNGLARRQLELGQIAEARSLIDSVAPFLAPVLASGTEPEGAAEAVETEGLRGEIALREGRWDEAVDRFESALGRADEISRVSPRVRVRILVGLAETQVRRDQPALAAAALTRARRWAEHGLSEQDPELGRLAAISGFFWHRVGLLEEAETAHRRALDLALRRGGLHQPAVADALGDLSLIYQQTGNGAAALRSGRQALEIQEKIFEPGHPALTIGRHNLGCLALANGDFRTARDLLTQALADEERLAAASPLAPLRARRSLALARFFLGDSVESEPSEPHLHG